VYFLRNSLFFLLAPPRKYSLLKMTAHVMIENMPRSIKIVLAAQPDRSTMSTTGIFI
jgi:hypothetical protein